MGYGKQSSIARKKNEAICYFDVFHRAIDGVGNRLSDPFRRLILKPSNSITALIIKKLG